MQNRKSFFLAFILILIALTPACSGNSEGLNVPPAPGQAPAQAQPLPPTSGEVVPAEAFTYLGAFRLPGGEERPRTFAYGGNAMTFNPDGDTQGAGDGFPGSLFIMGHNRIAYGEVPDGNQVAEVSIAAPIRSRDINALNTAAFVQDFKNVFAGHFTGLEEIPRVGMAYLNHPQTGPLIHFAWGQHLQSPELPSHGWFLPNLSSRDLRGAWYLGNRDPYSTTGYVFTLPTDWADAHTGGRYLVSGRMRDGGMGGMGPSLFAYTPWQANGSAPANGARLDELPLLLYENAYNSLEIVRSLNGYQHPDEWEGGAWISTASGQQAVLFTGTKSVGKKYWYGYINPKGAQYVCVDSHAEGIELMCRNADGTFCTKQELAGCCDESAGTCVSSRGWWSDRFSAQMMLYDPAQLALVAEGKLEAWQPQPYAVINIDEFLYLDPPEWDQVDLGWGDQRRFRIGEVAFDAKSGLLYVLELYADGAKPVVHVWSVK